MEVLRVLPSASGSPAQSFEASAPVPDYIGPKPIRQMNPIVRSKPGTEVQVRVDIDATGEVGSATPLNETLSNSFVAKAAADAARLWQFEPAKEKGHPVASTMILIFRFAAK